MGQLAAAKGSTVEQLQGRNLVFVGFQVRSELVHQLGGLFQGVGVPARKPHRVEVHVVNHLIVLPPYGFDVVA